MKSYNEALNDINKTVFDAFMTKRNERLSVRDTDLMRWARTRNKQLWPNSIVSFKAGKKWLLSFKSKYRIVSRKVINF